MSGIADSTAAPAPTASEPDWVRHAIWWHVYPLGFTGADTTGADRHPAHRLPQLTHWLDYAVRLGVSGIVLGPVFDSSTHGYDTLNYYRIDPRLGDETDFDRLITAAHEHGLRVLLDGVFNHVGRDFPAFAHVLAEGPLAAEADWFALDWDTEQAPRYATFEGHAGLVALNHATPAVADYVTDVMTHWLARGVDGWRLDAAYAVPARFWAEVLPRVRAAYPDAYLVGEVIHGDYATTVGQTGMDSITQYELWKAIWSSLNDSNLFELAWALRRHNSWLDTFVPLTFIGNHDVTRLASQIQDTRHRAHALLVLLTVGGTPSLYYGDEQAFAGVKQDRIGGDDAVRAAFPDRPEDLGSQGWATYRLHQDLIGLRRRHPWLHRARTTIVELTNRHMVYDATEGGHRLRILLNLADTELRHDSTATRVLAGTAAVEPHTTIIPGHSWAVLELPS
jgi:cyclomaltodextrinase